MSFGSSLLETQIYFRSLSRPEPVAAAIGGAESLP